MMAFENRSKFIILPLSFEGDFHTKFQKIFKQHWIVFIGEYMACYAVVI